MRLLSFVVVEDVWKSYKVGRVVQPALRGVSLSFDRGEFAAIVGPSGSGKSTLIHLIAGLDVPDKGRVIVGDVEVSSMGESARAAWRRRNVGIVFQFLHLVPVLTALENVVLPMELAGVPRGERRKHALDLLGFVGLEGKAGRLPAELSGGEQQRVAIARALAADPPLLLADEPTANLDSENKWRVVSLLREASRKGKTVIFTTHDLEVAEAADRIVRLSDGRVVEG